MSHCVLPLTLLPCAHMHAAANKDDWCVITTLNPASIGLNQGIKGQQLLMCACFVLHFWSPSWAETEAECSN